MVDLHLPLCHGWHWEPLASTQQQHSTCLHLELEQCGFSCAVCDFLSWMLAKVTLSDCLLSRNKKNNHYCHSICSDYTTHRPPTFASPSLATWMLAENTKAQQNEHRSPCNHREEGVLSLPPLGLPNSCGGKSKGAVSASPIGIKNVRARRRGLGLVPHGRSCAAWLSSCPPPKGAVFTCALQHAAGRCK